MITSIYGDRAVNDKKDQKITAVILPKTNACLATSENTHEVIKAGEKITVTFDTQHTFNVAKTFGLFDVVEIVGDSFAVAQVEKPVLVSASKVVETPAKDDTVLAFNDQDDEVPASVEEPAVSEPVGVKVEEKDDTAEKPVERRAYARREIRLDLPLKVSHDGEVVLSFKEEDRDAAVKFYKKAEKKYPKGTVTANFEVK